MSTPTSRFLEIDGLRLHVSEHPGPRDAPALLLAHGGMAHTGWWQPLIQELEGRLRVFAIDRRGHGRSDHATLDRYGWEIDLRDAETAAARLDAGPWILAGHSQGGLLSVYLAARRKIPAAGLVVLDSPFEPRAPALRQAGESLRRIPQLKYPSLEHAVRRFQPYPRPHYVEPEVLERIARESFATNEDGSVVSRFDWKRFRATEPEPHPLTAFSQHLEQVKVPTLLLRGEDSTILSRSHFEEFVARFPNATGVEVPNTTHSLHAEQPQRVAQEILQFVTGLAEAPARQ